MKLLFNTSTQQLQAYNRDDDEVSGDLDPVYKVYDVIQAAEPAYNAQTHHLDAAETLDHATKTVTRGWSVVANTPMPLLPVTVSFRRFAFALHQAGLYTQVREAALSTVEGEIWWTTAQSGAVRRDHPFVATVTSALGQTEAQVDAIFATALALPID